MSTMSKLKRKLHPEANGGEIITNAASYIPTSVRIEQYLSAGRQLNEYREALHDAIDDFSTADLADEASLDPVREPGFDPALLPQLEARAAARLNARRAQSLSEAGSNAEVKSNEAPAPEPPATDPPVPDQKSKK